MGKAEFGHEMAKMLPTMMRAVTSKMEAFLTKGNLAVSHIVVLDMLREKSPCTMGEIAKVLNLSMGAATGIIDKMIEGGIVKRERSGEDRRVVNVALAKKGETVASKVNQMRIDSTEELYSALTEAERKEYLRMIHKIYDDLRK